HYGFCGAIVSSSTTLSLPATSAALATMAPFSSSERTGPFNVTWPSCETTFTLWAYVDRFLSCMIARRTLCVSSRSDCALLCLSAVVWLVGSLVLVLSGAGACCEKLING